VCVRACVRARATYHTRFVLLSFHSIRKLDNRVTHHHSSELRDVYERFDVLMAKSYMM
jgi:hypothetical protein